MVRRPCRTSGSSSTSNTVIGSATSSSSGKCGGQHPLTVLGAGDEFAVEQLHRLRQPDQTAALPAARLCDTHWIGEREVQGIGGVVDGQLHRPGGVLGRVGESLGANPVGGSAEYQRQLVGIEA